MINKIDILGMDIDNYTVREAMLEVEVYLNNTVMNTVETIDMKMLDIANRNDMVKECIRQLDLAVIGEKEILTAAGIHSAQRISETVNHEFFREFAKRIIRNKKRVFLLANTVEQIQVLEEFLKSNYERMQIAGSCALEEKVGDPEAVVNEVNSATADIIFSILPSPTQEEFLVENKNKLDVKLWYGLGNDYIPGGRRNQLSQLAGRLIHKKRLQNRLQKYNKK